MREGDRRLRNLGVAGSLLDLSLGSSDLPNSNVPLLLPADPRGYIWLSGTTDAVGCTAPATATQFLATATDGSTSTGAATGGAAFTFTTAGSWLRVDLLNAGSAVVASFDCSLLTSGGATGLTDAYAVAWTITRATAGRKASVVPATGRAKLLLGADDYLECRAANTYQHPALGMKPGDSFSLVAVFRAFDTPVNNGPIMAKKANQATSGPGWSIQTSTGQQWRTAVSDGTTTANGSTGTATAGVMNVVVGAVNRATRTIIGYLNGVAGTAASIDAVGDFYTTDNFRIGRVTSNIYQDFEFFAAAVFKGRTLTRREVDLVTTYYGGGS
jgi:hypothetical protein